MIIGHIRLARSSRETLVWLMASVHKAGSVDLKRLAPDIDSSAQTASVHRRLARFFDEVKFNEAEVARLAVAALGLQGKPRHLALDRRTWQIGKTDLNILLLSVAYGELCGPLFWPVLDKAGNANAAEWIDLMQTFKDTLQNQPVAFLTGDRAFIGNAWIGSLQAAGIPHFLRLREALRRPEDLHIFNDDHAPLPLPQHPARRKAFCRMSQGLVAYWRLGKQRFAAGADRHSASRTWPASEHRQP